MLAIVHDTGFEPDVKAQQKKHRDMEKLKTVIRLIASDTPTCAGTCDDEEPLSTNSRVCCVISLRNPH